MRLLVLIFSSNLHLSRCKWWLLPRDMSTLKCFRRQFEVSLLTLTLFGFRSQYLAHSFEKCLDVLRVFISILFLWELKAPCLPFCYIFVSLSVTLSINCCLLQFYNILVYTIVQFKSIYLTLIQIIHFHIATHYICFTNILIIQVQCCRHLSADIK